MTGSKDDFEGAGLETLLDAARAAAPRPSSDLLDRIAADAALSQPRAGLPRAGAPSRGVWGQMLDSLGGWPTIGGLITATVAGVYIGIAQPGLIGIGTDVLDDTDFVTTELWPGDNLFFEEG